MFFSFYSKYIQLECNNFRSDGTSKYTTYFNPICFWAQIENSIAQKPTLQPTRSKQRNPSGNQEIMLI
jgi:hypothetical protein